MDMLPLIKGKQSFLSLSHPRTCSSFHLGFCVSATEDPLRATLPFVIIQSQIQGEAFLWGGGPFLSLQWSVPKRRVLAFCTKPSRDPEQAGGKGLVHGHAAHCAGADVRLLRKGEILPSPGTSLFGASESPPVKWGCWAGQHGGALLQFLCPALAVPPWSPPTHPPLTHYTPPPWLPRKTLGSKRKDTSRWKSSREVRGPGNCLAWLKSSYEQRSVLLLLKTAFRWARPGGPVTSVLQ